MDKITKFLQKLKFKELIVVQRIIKQLIQGELADLDIKKLKGFDDIYRVRTGKIRIIYSQNEVTIKLVEISRRNEKTYKDF